MILTKLKYNNNLTALERGSVQNIYIFNGDEQAYHFGFPSVDTFSHCKET